jgi:hypothetical protein
MANRAAHESVPDRLSASESIENPNGRVVDFRGIVALFTQQKIRKRNDILNNW